MKKSLILLAVGISMAMSCQLNELDVPKTKGETFYAVIEGSDMTRTTLDEDNNVLWSKNDQISIFEKSTVNSKYQVTSSSVGETYGTFTKVTAEDDSQTHRFNHNIAIYPYQGDLRYLSFSSSSSLYQFKGFSLPATQTYVKDSFASGAFPMVAVSENTELTFRNVCGGILLKLKGSKKITSIKIQGKNNEKLSGSATLRIYYDGTVPYIEMAYDASTSVNLDCGSGVQLNESKATEFIIVLPPLTFTKGFTVTVTDSNDEDHVIETSKSNEVKRSSLLAMPEMALNDIPSDPEPQEGDYIDEYGINHGTGIAIGNVVWAPVNCGYHETDYPYGKLYQWGRKYGQGYDGDATYPTVEDGTIKEGGVSLAGGQSKSNKDVFYLGYADNNYDWVYPSDSKLWNSGTESSPKKNKDNDPCPDGWRVPTYNELNELQSNHSSWTKNANGQSGYWLSGASTYADDVPQIFLPAAGNRSNSDGDADLRGSSGCCWSSRPNSYRAYYLYFDSGLVSVRNISRRASGYSVRCVQESGFLEETVPVSDIELSHESLDLQEGETAQLIATVIPSDATDKNVVWNSDTPSVATVDQSGLVKAISSGTARISATADSKVATCTVNVSSSGVDDYIDGFDDPENGVVILQKATRGSGTDIVIMGDGFSKKHFVKNGKYKEIMNKAYEDFFSIEPYTSLKEYFNVYYINVLSEEDHDAVPYYDYFGNQNGATQGTAVTKLGTQFTPGSTSIDGNDDVVLEYATQAIKAKGSSDGGECTDNEAYNRAHKALVIVLPNVKCYAGTCLLAWGSRNDYADAYSIAYCALGADDDGIDCKYTLLHEAGGHGFGKLGDEYSGNYLNRFNTIEWLKLRDNHNDGVYRNINEYWTEEEAQRWSGLEWDYTTESNVYWTELLDDSYGYTVSEGLGIYQGANTYTSLFCRPSENSVMNSHFNYNGQYFNAISRWAIWYRVMRLTNSTNASSFKSSLDEFINFDRTLNIIQNNPNVITRSNGTSSEMHAPLASPVLIECEWRGNRLVRP